MILKNINCLTFTLNIRDSLLYIPFLMELSWLVKFPTKSTSWLLHGSKYTKRICLQIGNLLLMVKNLSQLEG